MPSFVFYFFLSLSYTLIMGITDGPSDCLPSFSINVGPQIFLSFYYQSISFHMSMKLTKVCAHYHFVMTYYCGPINHTATERRQTKPERLQSGYLDGIIQIYNIWHQRIIVSHRKWTPKSNVCTMILYNIILYSVIIIYNITSSYYRYIIIYDARIMREHTIFRSRSMYLNTIEHVVHQIYKRCNDIYMTFLLASINNSHRNDCGRYRPVYTRR